MNGRPSLILLLLVCSACRPDTSTTTGAPGAAAVTVDSVPFVDLPATSSSGEMLYGNADDVARLDNGTIVVSDRATYSVRFLSPEGALIREVGRKGTGPFEFQMLHWIERCGTNALYVWDPWQDRVSVFDTLGNGVRQFTLTGGPWIWSCNQEGSFATVRSVQGFGLPSLTAPPMTAELATHQSDGSLLHSFGRLTFGKTRPLAAFTSIAVSGDRLYVGAGDSTVVVVATLDGRVLDTVSLGVTGRPVTPAQYRGTIEHTLLGLIREEDRELPRQYMLKVPAPDALPAFRGLLADPTGAVWAIISPFGDGATVLQGVDSTGKPLGRLRIPRDLDVREIGRDYLLAIAEDGEGEQHILVYRIGR